MTDMTSQGDTKYDLRAEEMLRRIADAVGVPPAIFRESRATEAELDQTLEMLQLWAQLSKSSDRRKLLAFARALIGGNAHP
ncbi:ABC-type multidrug transport system ATPase subunit [Methylobacterium sp. OAE515]|uniref:hypothetical protein n=1 Tax=Methylobacterium sp. OAE515 TaxID=2817895 RepID=UPI00178ADD55